MKTALVLGGTGSLSTTIERLAGTAGRSPRRGVTLAPFLHTGLTLESASMSLTGTSRRAWLTWLATDLTCSSTASATHQGRQKSSRNGVTAVEAR